MPLIWAAISAHGYGHAAQVVPVLNALGLLIPGLKAILRTTVPASFFNDRLNIPWELQSVQQDVGCLQNGPLEIDVPATWDGHAAFHEQWDERLEAEVRALRAARPAVILADTPYLACAAGALAGIPVVGLANFTWSEILRPFAQPNRPEHATLMDQIERGYAGAGLALRIAPGLLLRPYRTVQDIGPIAEPAQPQRDALLRTLDVRDDERLVLIGFGGIPLASLPWAAMDRMEGYRFIVDGPEPIPSRRIHRSGDLPFSFKALLASVDIVMTKPGYGTVVEAVALGMSIVYVRRFIFADEPPLVDFVSRYGRAIELSSDDLFGGNWRPAFEAVLSQTPHHPRPACSGAADAARHFAVFF
jgi:hypothetical protein